MDLEALRQERVLRVARHALRQRHVAREPSHRVGELDVLRAHARGRRAAAGRRTLTSMMCWLLYAIEKSRWVNRKYRVAFTEPAGAAVAGLVAARLELADVAPRQLVNHHLKVVFDDDGLPELEHLLRGERLLAERRELFVLAEFDVVQRLRWTIAHE